MKLVNALYLSKDNFVLQNEPHGLMGQMSRSSWEPARQMGFYLVQAFVVSQKTLPLTGLECSRI